MIAQFEQYLLTEKRYSPHTVNAYKTDLLQFVDFLGLDEADFHPEEVTHLLVRGWVVFLMKNGFAARSVNRKLASIKTFFNYLRRKGVVSRNPASNVVHPKQPKRLPEFIDESTAVKINQDVNDDPDVIERRDALILELLYTSGIRRAELISLKVHDVDLQNETIRVLGKGQKERIIPLLPSVVSLLKYYISYRDEAYSSPVNPYLFLTAKGEQLYPNLVERIVKEKLKLAGVNGKKSPHVLRHTFATHMLDSGADLLSIKEMLGHSSIGTTQIYTHNTLEKIKNTYRKAHPRADSK